MRQHDHLIDAPQELAHLVQRVPITVFVETGHGIVDDDNSSRQAGGILFERGEEKGQRERVAIAGTQSIAEARPVGRRDRHRHVIDDDAIGAG